jgi:TPR repeat protein
MARYEFSPREMAERSAEAGRPDALFELGLIYSAGRDVAVDLIEAHKWFNLAAVQGNEEARTYRAQLARDMSREEIAEAQRQARAWLKSH